jgi:hypothetical protein
VPFVAGIAAARQRIVARTDDDRENFLRKSGLSKAETSKVIEAVLGEVNRKPESIFDFVQGITALLGVRRIRTQGLSSKARPGA